MVELRKEAPKFALYKSELTHKFFVRYPDQPEKEITEWEYSALQKEKDRAFENKINDSVNYAQADKLKVVDSSFDTCYKRKIVFYEHPSIPGILSFECGTCYGECYKTKDSLVIDSIFNSQKGNGDFKLV